MKRATLKGVARSLALVEKIAPAVGFRLRHLSLERVEPVVDPALNCKVGEFWLHHPHHPEKEAAHWWSEVQKDCSDVLYVYGIGLGYGWPQVKGWLREREERRLIFVEDDLEVLFSFCHVDAAGEILSHPQVELLVDPHALQRLLWELLGRKLTISALPSYAAHRESDYRRIRDEIIVRHRWRNTHVFDHLNHSAAYYKQVYRNLFSLPFAKQFSCLRGQFSGVPAIVCGAGPSLTGQLEEIAWAKERAVLLAGGSAINALNFGGIDPHLCLGSDSNIEQLFRVLDNTSHQVPYLFRGHLYADVLLEVGGPLVYLGGTREVALVPFLEERLGIQDSPLDEGRNVVNMGVAVATALGCNPIVLAGADFSYTDSRPYAAGIFDDGSEEFPAEELKKRGVLDVDALGDPVYTRWKWKSEAHWITQFAKEHPEITLLNATRRGLAIEGVEHTNLKEAIPDCRHPVEERIVQSFRTSQSCSREEVEELTESILQSLSRCGELLKKRMKESGMKRTLLDHELAEEVAFRELLATFEQVYRHSLLRFPSMSEEEKEEKTAQFLQETIEVHTQLLQEAKSFPVAEKREPLLQHREGGLDGECQLLFADGERCRSMRYAKGKREGRDASWYPGGARHHEALYEGGFVQGAIKIWHPNGTLSCERRQTRKGERRTRRWNAKGEELAEEVLHSYDI